jgi:hypothetical protein
LWGPDLLFAPVADVEADRLPVRALAGPEVEPPNR